MKTWGNMTGKKRSLLYGTGFLLAALLLCGLLGLLVIREVVSPQAGASLIRLMGLLGVFAVCRTAAGQVPKQRLAAAVLSAGVLILVGLGGKLLLFPGRPLHWQGMAVVIVMGAAAGIAASRKKTVRRNRVFTGK